MARGTLIQFLLENAMRGPERDRGHHLRRALAESGRGPGLGPPPDDRALPGYPERPMLFLLPRPASSLGRAVLFSIGNHLRLVSALHLGRALS